MSETPETETDPGEVDYQQMTARDLPPVVRPLAERGLVPVEILAESLCEFTLTGAMVAAKTGGRELAPRRLSHFAPDMLTRLAHELAAPGLVEIEISESRIQTRGFAFFLDEETLNDIVPPAPEPEPEPEPVYPDGELGAAMQMMKMQTEAMLTPIMAGMEALARRLDASLEVQSEQVKRGMVFADLLADQQIARAQKMLEAEQQTPEQTAAAHMNALNAMMETAAVAKKAMAKHAPRGDTDADALDRLAGILENPRVAAIGRGFLKVMGGDIGAPITVEAVTPEAGNAAQLPNLFSVPKETA